MTQSHFAQQPGWKQALAIVVAGYATLVWVLPTFVLFFVNTLPFVQETTLVERLPFSIAATAVVILLMVVLNRGRRSPRSKANHKTGSLRDAIGQWFGVFVGFALATYSGAELSANAFGLAANVLPHESYRATVVIDSAYHRHGRRKSVTLEYREPATGEPRHLVLSGSLFSYPDIRRGDVLELRGQRTVVGVYIKEFSRLRGEVE